MPRVYILRRRAPNARHRRNPQHAAVAVTQGILRLLSAEELEVSWRTSCRNVKNRDILIGSVAATLPPPCMVLAHMAAGARSFGTGGRDDRAAPVPSSSW